MRKMPSAVETKSSTSRKCTYKHAELIRVYDKAGLLLGYCAKPEKLFEYGKLGVCNAYYQVTCDESTGIWACTCRGNAEFHLTCKHIEAAQCLNELRLGVVKVEAEEVAEVAPVVVPAECQIGDMSVQDHLLNEELKHYESELRYEGIADLRMRVSHAELSVSSRSKEPLIVALVAHRRDTLLAAPVQEENVSEVSAEMSAVCPVDVTLISAFVDPVLSSEELPELPLAEEEVLSFEPLEQEEFLEAVADAWTAEEIERIRQAALPVRKVSTIEAAIIARQKMYDAPLNGNHSFRII
jgi:hypothetical protein